MIRNEKGFILSTVLWFMFLLAFAGTAAMWSTRTDLKITYNYREHTKAIYMAEAALDYAKITFVSDALDNDKVVTWNSSTIFSGNTTGTVVVTPDATDPDIVTMLSTVTTNGSTAIIEITVKRTQPTMAGVLGAITTAGPTATNGNITVDGRDHTLDGTLIENSGSYGLFSGSTYLQDGDSIVGGTSESLDYTPASPGAPEVIQENGAGVMLTPDTVIGMPEGLLKEIALSGFMGSQYVTDPANLKEPLAGVTYVELPVDDSWWLVSGDTILSSGTGVLVVHNSATNAKVKNLNKGTFTGLVIADDIVHIHNEIIGAVVSLTPAPSEGNVIGNGNGNVLYSSEALNNLFFLDQYDILAWREVF